MLRVSLLCLFFFTVCHCQNFEDVSETATVFTATELPMDESGQFLPRYMASVGNGHLATTVYTDKVNLNGLYNGDRGESHRARIPSKNNIRIINPGKTDAKFSLDVEKGVFVETFKLENYTVEHRTFAHRFYTRVIVSQFYIKPLPETVAVPLTLRFSNNKGAMSEDMDFEPEEIYSKFPAGIPATKTCGRTLTVEDAKYQPNPTAACVIATIVPKALIVQGEETVTYFASYGLSPETTESDFDGVASLVTDGNDLDVYNSHVTRWTTLWNEEGKIEVVGNLAVAKVVNGALYYILSALPVTTPTNSPQEQFYGLSPGGLAYGELLADYQGHSFWDTETWMFPPIVYLYPDAARELLNYRLNGIAAARDRATETGYTGTRFPWESGYTGREVTPDCCPETRDMQVHITGDIAFAIRQYIGMTRDAQWLMNKTDKYELSGCGLLKEIAEFWASRVDFNSETKFYDINIVMPPDEDKHGVNNSIYTNIQAGYSIFFAKYVEECYCPDLDIPEAWVSTAKSLKLPYDEIMDFHPEFDGYNGSLIKQADVVLVGYPLMYKMDEKTRRNDLDYYEQVTRDSGPAMTWAMHTIGHVELGDSIRAERIFERSYDWYKREPFKVWTEAKPPTLGAINFITGMGGFLQSILTAYGGLRLHVEELQFLRPRPPPKSTGLNINGISYLGNSVDLLIEHNSVKFLLKSLGTHLVLSDEAGAEYDFNTLGASHVFNDTRQLFKLKSVTPTLCALPSDEIGIPFPG